jgi:hypothetical protein
LEVSGIIEHIVNKEKENAMNQYASSLYNSIKLSSTGRVGC